MDRTIILYPRYDTASAYPLMVDLDSITNRTTPVIETGDRLPIILQFCEPSPAGDGLDVVTLEAGDTIVLGAKKVATDAQLLFSVNSWTETTLDAETAYQGTINLTTIPATFWQGQPSQTVQAFFQVRDAGNNIRFSRRFSLTLNRGLYTAEPTGDEDPPFLDIPAADGRYLSILPNPLTEEEADQALENLNATASGIALLRSATTAAQRTLLGLGTNDTATFGDITIPGETDPTFYTDRATGNTYAYSLNVTTTFTVGGYSLTLANNATISGTNTGDQIAADIGLGPTDDVTFNIISALSVNLGGTISASGGTISGTLTLSASPTASTHAANKAYVDNAIAGFKWKASVVVATTANGTLSTAFANGQTVDGVTLVTGDRILIKDQSTPSQNGIYTVNASGSPTRATDADTGTELVNAAVCVQTGTVNADRTFTCTNNSITIGSTSITWVNFAATIGSLVSTNNLSDLASASTARTNLGLGDTDTVTHSTIIANTAIFTYGSTTDSSVLIHNGTITAANADCPVVVQGNGKLKALTTALSGTYGGTGVNNGSNTLTLGGNVSFGAMGRTLASATDAAAGRASLDTLRTIQTSYSSGTAYAAGEIVMYYGLPWLCILAATGKEPLTNPTYWTPLGSLVDGGRWFLKTTANAAPSDSLTNYSGHALADNRNYYSSVNGGTAKVRWTLTGLTNYPVSFPDLGTYGYTHLPFNRPGYIDFLIADYSQGTTTLHLFLGKFAADAVGDLTRAGVQLKITLASGARIYKLGVHNGSSLAETSNLAGFADDDKAKKVRLAWNGAGNFVCLINGTLATNGTLTSTGLNTAITNNTNAYQMGVDATNSSTTQAHFTILTKIDLVTAYGTA